MTLLPVSVVFLATAFSALPLAAQTLRGVISGRVFDDAGRAVPGASIELTHEETSARRRTQSGARGEFALPHLAPGAYRVEASRQGFRNHVLRLTLLVNQEIHVELPLAAGERADSVEVTAPRELLRTETASLGAAIENRYIRELPLDGRNFFELSLLAPGALPAAQGSASTVRGDFAFNINGAREDSNLFLLDGVYNGDPKLNSFAVTPPVDGIREFEVLASAYDASFGRNTGAQVNVVLKSGTNQLHGTAYEFFRNARLDARNFFAPASEPKPSYQRNQFGFSLGGPIAKNRTFFFFDFEGRRMREGITRLTRVPTAAARAGDFSNSSPAPRDPSSGQPLPGGRLPAFFQNPVGSAIANLYPLPNRNDPLQNFVSSPVHRDSASQFDARVDHAFRASELSARYSFQDRDTFQPFSGTTFAAVPGFGVNLPRRAQNAMLSETRTLKPTLLNEVRLGFNRVAGGSYQQNINRDLNRQVGLPVLSPNPRDTGLSFLTVTGYSPLGDEFNNPQHSAATTYQVIDHATYSSGRHLVKFGADLRFLRQNAYRDVQSRGFLQFLGFITGNPLADLLVGAPTVTGGALLDNPQRLRTESYNFFAQDAIRLRPGLTLTLGLRYEFTSPPVDTLDRANLFDPATGSLVRVGAGGAPRAGYFPDRNNFGPRAGIAWSPGSGRAVLRAGYGLYYDQPSLAPSEGLYFNAPYFDLRLYVTLPFYPLSIHNPFPRDYPVPVPGSAFSFDRLQRTPYTQHWNAGVQRALGRAAVVEVSYAASKGNKLLSARDINQPRPSASPNNPRPLPRFADITQLEARGNSIYHSLQGRFERRFQRGFSALASYTFGKSIDDASSFFPSAGDPNFPQDSANFQAERGRSNFDVRQRFSMGFSYDLPFGKNKLYGGWTTHGILSFQTGRPFTVALLPEIDNSNTGRSNLGFGANDRPDARGPARAANPAPEAWFHTAAFAMPAPGAFGNAGRNILDGPGQSVVNFALHKQTRLSERAALQFRFEAFNFFNRVNLDLPDIFFGSPSFGRVASAQAPRRIQFGLKLLF